MIRMTVRRGSRHPGRRHLVDDEQQILQTLNQIHCIWMTPSIGAVPLLRHSRK